ncbi:MAG: hypothetical protein AVDCRST_MAG93-1983 [uncultured Chloroflexia bacterium]|uniref:Uncharacterized protein n=1 Tax=uncultured Chloroflexia bacterium TaxID=1672391 RepID=A0A6J4ILF3_9CHLR|nr:MAG: hypothetical protein AVDCRST_MAG93-1983 [uncultured Chloroflexia bacterium]
MKGQNLRPGPGASLFPAIGSSGCTGWSPYPDITVLQILAWGDEGAASSHNALR